MTTSAPMYRSSAHKELGAPRALLDRRAPPRRRRVLRVPLAHREAKEPLERVHRGPKARAAHRAHRALSAPRGPKDQLALAHRAVRGRRAPKGHRASTGNVATA